MAVTAGGADPTAFPRVLRRFALFAIAFSVVSITTGIFVNYAYGLTTMGPAAVWLWPVAAVGQVLVVLVLAENPTIPGSPGASGATGGADVWFCSDEHVTFAPDVDAVPVVVGGRVLVVPAHVDPTVALHERMHLVRDDEVVDTWEVDLRGW